MAATTSVEELNNPTSVEEPNNPASVEESTNSTAAEELTISASIEKVAQAEETTIGEIPEHVPKRNRRKASLPSELQQIRESIREEDEFDPYAPTPPPPARLQPLFKEISDKLEKEGNEQGRQTLCLTSAANPQTDAEAKRRVTSTDEGEDTLSNATSYSAGQPRSQTNEMAHNGTAAFPLPDDQDEVPYSRASWHMDAAIVIVTWRLKLEHNLPHLDGVIVTEDYRRARSILGQHSPRSKQIIMDRAEAVVRAPGNSTESAAAFQRFLDRFQEGPTEELTQETSPPRNGSEHGQGHHRQTTTESRRPTEHRSRSPQDFRQGEIRSSREKQGRQEYAGARDFPTRSGPPGPGDDDDPSDDDHFPSGHRGYRQRHPRKSNEENVEDGRYSNVRPLNPKDLGIYNGSTSAVAYARRITTFTSIYGPRKILATLPLCMEGEASDWYDSLDNAIHAILSESVEAWKIHLVSRFRADAAAALSKADAMHHRFEEEHLPDKLNVRQYITKKLALYIEAGESNYDLIVKRIHAQLDPALGQLVKIHPSHNTMAEFTENVYGQEAQARANWKRTDEHFRRQEKEFSEKLDKLEKQRPAFQSRQSQYEGRGYQSQWTPARNQYLVPTDVVQRYGQITQPPFPAYQYNPNNGYNSNYGYHGRYNNSFPSNGLPNKNPNANNGFQNGRQQYQQQPQGLLPKGDGTPQSSTDAVAAPPKEEGNGITQNGRSQAPNNFRGGYNNNGTYPPRPRFGNNYQPRGFQQARVFYTESEAPGWELVDGQTLAQMTDVFQVSTHMDAEEQSSLQEGRYEGDGTDSGNETGGR